MKWLGQHVFNFVAYFNDEVFYDGIPEGTIETDYNLGLDANNRLVRAAVGTNTSSSTFRWYFRDDDDVTKGMSHGKYFKVYGLNGVTVDWTGGAGTSGDPYDLAINAIGADVFSASRLTTPRSINGVGFNGTADITIPSNFTTVIGTLTPANGGTGLTSFTDKSVLITQDSGTSTLTALPMNTNGLLMIGGSSGPAANVLTEGSNVTITNTDGGITIAATNTFNTYANSWVDDGNDAKLRLTKNGSVNQDLNIIAGNNITLTPSGSDLTIAATGGGGGGGAITVKTNGDDNNTVSTVRSDVTELIFYGADSNVKLYDNGTGSVIVDHHASLDFAPSYNGEGSGGVNSNLNSVSVERIIGIPGTGNGNQYYPGDWAGTKGKKTTGGSTVITFNSNTAVSGMAGNPKVEVTVYGPQDASTSGSTNILGQDGSNNYTFLYNVDSSDTDGQSGNARGVTVDIGALTADGVGSALKGTINVTIDPDNTGLATISSTHTGSQKFHQVKIRHLDNAGNQLGIYSSPDSWFHDNNPLAPIAPTPSASISASSTVRLSNIAYYGSATFTVTTSGYTNMFRDTSRYTSMGTGIADTDNWWQIYNQFDNGVQTLFDSPTKSHYKTKNDKQSAHSADLLLTAGNSVGQTSDNYAIDGSKWALNHAVQVKTKVFNDENTNTTWVVDGAYGTAFVDSSTRNYHTYTDDSTDTFEGHKSEKYRLSDNTETTWDGLSSSETVDYWKALAVGGSGSVQKSLRLDPYNSGNSDLGDYITLTNDILPSNNTAFTVAGWVRKASSDVDSLPIIFSLNGTNGDNYLLLGFFDYNSSTSYSPAAGKKYWFVGYKQTSGVDSYSTSTDNGDSSNTGGQVGTGSIAEALPNHSTWYHVAFVLKHNSSSNTDVLVYVDGTLTWSTEMYGEFDIPTASNSIRPYQFGMEWDSNNTKGNYFDGWLSEWGIWDEELAANEISAIASSTTPVDLTASSGNYNSQANLKAYYKLDDDVTNDDGTITDSSGQGNHGLTKNVHANVGHLSFQAESPFTTGQNNIDYTGKGLNSNNEHILQGYFNGAWRLKHPNDTVGTIAAQPTHVWTNPGNGTYKYMRFFHHGNTAYDKGNIKINGLHKGADTSPASGSFRHQVAAGNLDIHFMVPGATTSNGNATGRGIWIPLSVNFSSGTIGQGCWKHSTDNKQGASDDFYYDIQLPVSFNVLIIRIQFNEGFSGDIKDLTWQANVYQNE